MLEVTTVVAEVDQQSGGVLRQWVRPTKAMIQVLSFL